MKSSKNILKGIGSIVLSSLVIIGCGNENPDNTNIIKQVDSSVAPVIVKDIPIQKLDNAIFSVPSPIQLGQIIQKSGAVYNEDLLNNPSSVNNYSDVASQSLNLGVYGADLGYTALYEKSQKSIKFMKSVQKLSTNIGIADAFDMKTISAIQRNLTNGNKDSLLYVISNAYRKADDFLQVSDRKYIGSLVVVGGWLESMHFAGLLGMQNKGPEIQNMVGMQKHTLNTMIDKMLSRYLNEPGVEEISNYLEEIRVLFDQVEIKYEYAKPETDKASKSTKLKSKSTVEISDELFGKIVDKIEEIRVKVIK
jgi:hypothetical protein|tara:strand:- start:8521 stop:9444 length:924 start_codon:yes stop_codon:yes gene_type:complete